VQRGIIDRLEVEYDEGGEVITATVIDFKTDKLSPPPDMPLEEYLQDHAQRYREQLGAYRSVAAGMLGVEEEKVGMTVLFVEVGAGVELG